MAELVNLRLIGRSPIARQARLYVFIYAIKSRIKNWIYVGFTKDIDERIRRHNSGRERSTKPFRPYDLIYTETVEKREEVRKREKYFKSGVGKEFLKNLIK